MLHNIPPLPEQVLGLADDVREELCDAEYIKRGHGRRTTYKSGCHGPLCLRADRLWRRNRYAEARRSAGKAYSPSQDLRRDARDDELDEACDVYVAHAKAIEIHVRLVQLYNELAGELTG